MNQLHLLSREMLEAILNGIDEAIHAVDQNGVTIYYNRIAAQYDGLAAEEVVGKHLLKVFPSLTEETSTLLKVLKTKQAIFHQNQQFENKNGQLIETVNTTIPIMLDNELLGAVEIAKNYGEIKTLSNKLMDLQSRIYKKNNQIQEQSMDVTFTLKDFITKNRTCLQLIEETKLFAGSDLPIVIYGETGTGKEIIAQGIHAASLRKSFPFIAQNCGAIPESLLESILFGTEKGSYTGAVERKGLLEIANGGTLFLDELNSMPIELQTKLLRVLEDGTIRRVGGTKAFKIDVRIITAMNDSPDYCLKHGKLRADLYFRLSTCSMHIPPLRKRPEDIMLLADHFLSSLPKNPSYIKKQLAKETEKVLVSHSWPGNVRELKNTMEYILVKCPEQIVAKQYLPKKFQDIRKETAITYGKNISLKQILQETEENIIQDALQLTDGNVQKAAKLLNIPRQTLQYKITKLLKQ